MPSSIVIAQLASGIFFLIGLLTGIWKYRAMISSADGCAPVYVDFCHRSALLYSFACLVVAEFARLSVWSESVDTVAVIAQITFFGTAVGTYAVHGWLQDTDNMLRRPHLLGDRHISSAVVSIYVSLLITAELGGFVVLFSGFVYSL